MSDLTIALPAGFYRLGGFNDNGIDVYHNGSDGFSTEFGSFTNFDRLNENVNPFNPSLYHKKMEELVNSSLPRTPLSDRTNAENGVLSARLNRSRDGLEWTVWITPHWNTPKLSPGRTATSYLLEVLSPRTPPSSPPSIPKSFTVLNIEEIPIWIDTPDTPMTPTEQRDFFEPSNSPYSSPPLPSVRSSSFDLQLHDPPLRDPHVFLQPHDPNAHWTLCSVHPPRRIDAYLDASVRSRHHQQLLLWSHS